jgi:non-haem Fe2+, alpha-ketoglutarate-dependent halogenase
VRYQ